MELYAYNLENDLIFLVIDYMTTQIKFTNPDAITDEDQVSRGVRFGADDFNDLIVFSLPLFSIKILKFDLIIKNTSHTNTL